MAGLRITDPKEISRLVKKGLIKDPNVEHHLKQAKKSIKKEITICLLPPVEPAHVLYQAIVGEFGRLYDGGEAVFELTFPSFKRKYRVDTALPSYKIVIELDGWQYVRKVKPTFIFLRFLVLNVRFSLKAVKSGHISKLHLLKNS
ncbi:MAG: hypothetical protein ACKO8L_08715 [Flavobacterium sp.]